MPLDVAFIQSERLQNSIHYFSTLGSTMTEGTRLAHEGAPHGTVVLANEQLAGVGRQGRHWHSQAEVGIYSSVLLRLPLAPTQLPVASLLIGLAVAEAIQSSTELKCDLRWPNDVLIQEKKVAGVLPHLVAGCIVAGIGINVNNQSFEEGLRTPATSLAIASGRAVSREQVLVAVLESLERFCKKLDEQGVAALLDSFARASTYVMGRHVMIEETEVHGITAGLDESGFLLLQTDRGLERIASGGVRPVV